MIKLKAPLDKSEVRKLRLNEKVLVSGVVFTARDRAHQYLLKDKKLKSKLKNGIIYHCGPIIKSKKVISAGPTSSVRLEGYESDIIRKHGIRAIIGKGGMGRKTVEACKKHGCVYLSATGGAGALIAQKIKKIRNVYKKEFGVPEAIWELEVEDFPAVVTIDARGNSLHDNILKKSRNSYQMLIK